MKNNFVKKVFSGAAALLTVFAVGLLALTILTTPASAESTDIPTTTNELVTSNIPVGSCGANGAACDGTCSGTCGGSCPAAKTGGCGCGK
ncbi:hypothetical protein K9M74_04815 [Candidatus Woesearchaeota archaeon]|nr:hypothetical protein [Candidatus Woesearchaeota archaeon]